MRTLSSLRGRKIVTESGRELGRCHDVRAELGASRLRVTGVVLGRKGRLEHFGIGAEASASLRALQSVVAHDRLDATEIGEVEAARVAAAEEL